MSRPFASPPPPVRPQREFHVSRAARDRYRFDEGIFSLSGNVVLADFAAARRFAEAINATRDLVHHPESAVRPGEIAALGLIDEINHLLFRRFRQATRPDLLREALDHLAERLGPAAVDRTLARFCLEFPPLAVHRGEASVAEWLAGETAGENHREIALEELTMLSLANANPAFSPFRELFDDTPLGRETVYPQLLVDLETTLAQVEVPEDLLPGPGERHILRLLRAPALAAPGSLEEQLRLVLARFAPALAGTFELRALTAIDVIKEEGRAFQALAGALGALGAPGAHGDAGAGAVWHHPPGHELTAADVPLPSFAPLAEEPEAFTPDRDWMPRLVLLARNAFVWLDQLSRQHGRTIATLDAIPDRELDELARRGITGLWLIGLWQRSAASRRIKQIMGNPEAVASAYSLDDYAIATELGGDAALDDLAARCARRGIRLASDMVPNHVGVDGRWVVEHPDWFVQLREPPFPVYSFTGPDLSHDPRVSIQIEDRYWTRADAAVVFKRVDRASGDTRYLYHGNDGTNMPWNDTAQLDYLRPEVREAVMQTILRVARRFPIIRFDAAMTLAKRHFHRLWYPAPGTGGDIPSRAERGLTAAEFDRAMPEEFWREVVDRCGVEAPDTLLLAEAFWLMESYFVRTLGMHRVYNSAFMVCLRDEENAKYRRILKETAAFDVEILYRFVNFLNNPDERTAVDQFGKGDKYFGVCTLMATLPGLPMFGHGQVEGFAERYGMEYRCAYYDETPDPWLLERHEREIFPLLHRRRLFAGVEAFALFDIVGDHGVLEDVYAIANRHGEERALVLFHNRPATVRGRLLQSSPATVRRGDGGKRTLSRTLAESLALRGAPDDFLVFRELASGLEHLVASRELVERGFVVELGPYQTRVLLDFRELADRDGRLRELAMQLAGRGVPSIEEALHELALQPLHGPFSHLLDPELLRAFHAPPFPRLGPPAAASAAALGAHPTPEQPKTKTKAQAGENAATDSVAELTVDESTTSVAQNQPELPVDDGCAAATADEAVAVDLAGERRQPLSTQTSSSRPREQSTEAVEETLPSSPADPLGVETEGSPGAEWHLFERGPAVLPQAAFSSSPRVVALEMLTDPTPDMVPANADAMSRSWALFERTTEEPGALAARERAAEERRERERAAPLAARWRSFLAVAAEMAGIGDPDLAARLEAMRAEAVDDLVGWRRRLGEGRLADPKAESPLASWLAEHPSRGAVVIAWLLLRRLGRIVPGTGATERGATWFAEWRLGRVVEAALRALGAAGIEARRESEALRLLLEPHLAAVLDGADPRPSELLAAVAASEAGRTLLGVNRFGGVLWLRREGVEETDGWLTLAATLGAEGSPRRAAPHLAPAAAAAGYRLDATLARLAADDAPAALASTLDDAGGSPP